VRFRLRSYLFCFSLVTLSPMFISPLQASVAYIVNCCNHPSTVSVFHAPSGLQAAQWSVGTGASDAVFSPDGSVAYVASSVSQSVTAVKVSTGTTLATIPVGYGVSRIVINPKGSQLIAESYDFAYESHLIAIDTVSMSVTQSVGFSSFLGPLAMSPDGKILYVTSLFSSQPGLLVLDTVFLTVKATVPVTTAVGVAVTPDGRFAYVPNFGPGNPYVPGVAVVDTSSNTVVTTIPLGNIQLNPQLIQISPDGSMAWVGQFPLYNGVLPVITVIQTSTNQIRGNITLLENSSPGAMVFSPDGTRASGSGGCNRANRDSGTAGSSRTIRATRAAGSTGQPKPRLLRDVLIRLSSVPCRRGNYDGLVLARTGGLVCHLCQGGYHCRG
jgi:DNA-binding beta-propeller fold protein YncE